MEIIIKSNTPFIDVLGKQNQAGGGKHRLLNYSVSQRTTEGLLIFNTLSCEMVLLDDSEVNQLYSLPYLLEHWFVVPEGFDDRKFAKQYRDVREMLLDQPSGINTYVVLPTTDCNARCFYCYEMGRSRLMMSESTALKVADYIINNYFNLEEDRRKELSFEWFGGEPLYNYKIIDIICNKLKEANVPYHSKMVSNAYLFNEELVRQASTLWNVKNIQVTHDGTEDVYNRSKAYIHKEGSAFQRVMDNIGLLLDAEIKVVVRMNIDMHNAEDLKQLAYILKERFGGRKVFSCYSHPLFEAGSPTAHIRTEERRALVYQKQHELRDLLKELCLSGKSSSKLPKDIPFNHCMADSHESVVIAPTGQIGLCEHYTDTEFFSHIDTPDTRDLATYNKFQQRCDDLDLCHDCPVYPQCIRLKMCEEGSLCFPEIRQQKTDNIKKAMLAKYDRWKKKAADDDNVEVDDNADENDNC